MILRFIYTLHVRNTNNKRKKAMNKSRVTDDIKCEIFTINTSHKDI